MVELLQSLSGQWVWERIGPFALVEASVAAEATLPLIGAVGGESMAPMPFPGKIVAMSVGAEASSNFTLNPTLDGVEQTSYAVTVNAVRVYQVYDTPLEFDAGAYLGIEVGTDTTSKDVAAWLHVLLDVTG